jgi:hypothetical protein
MENAFEGRPTGRGTARPAGARNLLRQGDCVQFREGRVNRTGLVLALRSDTVLLEYHNGRFRLARLFAYACVRRVLSPSVCKV